MLNRRTVLKGLCAGCSMVLGPGKSRAADQGLPTARFRVWDQHGHLHSVPGRTPEERMAFLVKCMDRVGVERIILSQGYSDDQHPNPPEQFRLENDRVLRAVKAFPDRAYGSAYVTPALLDFSIQELNRCVRDGPMVMIRLTAFQGARRRHSRLGEGAHPGWKPAPVARADPEAGRSCRMIELASGASMPSRERCRTRRPTRPIAATCMRPAGLRTKAYLLDR